MRPGVHAVVAIVSIVSLVAGCTGGDTRDASSGAADGAITIASFDFDESEVLAFVYAKALEAHGYPVRVQESVGPRELLMPALVKGLVDLIPEYAGTALAFVSLGEAEPSGDPIATYEALQAALARDGRLVALAPSPGQNTNAVVVTSEVAEEYGLVSISDLSRVDDQLVFGGPPECPTRPFCIPGLEKVYGLHFRDFLALDAGGQSTHDALATSHVDVALLFSTDPAIREGGLVALEDDRQLQPAENVTPLVNADALELWGRGMADVLDDVSSHITTDELRALNDAVARGTSPSDAATRWVAAKDLA
jgi:osmoprotectant transport system substrate-binding protein